MSVSRQRWPALAKDLFCYVSITSALAGASEGHVLIDRAWSKNIYIFLIFTGLSTRVEILSKFQVNNIYLLDLMHSLARVGNPDQTHFFFACSCMHVHHVHSCMHAHHACWSAQNEQTWGVILPKSFLARVTNPGQAQNWKICSTGIGNPSRSSTGVKKYWSAWDCPSRAN